MANITLSLPDELKEEMEKFPEINWSVIARESIRQRLMLLRRIREFSKDSRLTEEDAIKMGREINKGLSKSYSSK